MDYGKNKRFQSLIWNEILKIAEDYHHESGIVKVIDMETGIVYSGYSDEGTGNLGEELKMYFSEYYFSEVRR